MSGVPIFSPKLPRDRWPIAQGDLLRCATTRRTRLNGPVGNIPFCPRRLVFAVPLVVRNGIHPFHQAQQSWAWRESPKPRVIGLGHTERDPPNKLWRDDAILRETHVDGLTQAHIMSGSEDTTYKELVHVHQCMFSRVTLRGFHQLMTHVSP